VQMRIILSVNQLKAKYSNFNVQLPKLVPKDVLRMFHNAISIDKSLREEEESVFNFMLKFMSRRQLREPWSNHQQSELQAHLSDNQEVRRNPSCSQQEILNI